MKQIWLIPQRLVVIAVVLALFGGACVDPQTTVFSTPTPLSEPSTGWFSVYFTDPDNPNAADYRGGPDEALVEAMDGATTSLEIAIYDLNLYSLRDAILRAYDRGVEVRMVAESDNMDRPEMQELVEAGINIVTDQREGYMHNKFAIIDRQEVWTGSMNYTTTDAYRNDNNLVRIRSSKVAEDYLTEFEEMWAEDLFGPADRPQTPYPAITIDGTLVEVFFSPDDHTADRLIELIQDAQESIYFLAFSFTSDDIADAMLERAANGVTVAGVFESGQVGANTGGEYDRLLIEGLDVRIDGNRGNMHNKIIIIDGQIVVTGSYNFSANAEKRNDENTLILHDPQIAELYYTEFLRIFDEAQH